MHVYIYSIQAKFVCAGVGWGVCTGTVCCIPVFVLSVMHACMLDPVYACQCMRVTGGMCAPCQLVCACIHVYVRRCALCASHCHWQYATPWRPQTSCHHSPAGCMVGRGLGPTWGAARVEGCVLSGRPQARWHVQSSCVEPMHAIMHVLLSCETN